MLDEPTAALGVAQTAQVLDLIRKLKERGLGVVVISHNLTDVFAVADRIVVLFLGRNAGEFKRTETTREEVVGAITSGPGTPAGVGGDERRRRGGAGMTTAERDPRLQVDPEGVRGLWTRFTRRVRQGELGSLPVIIGLVVIWLYFSLSEENFLTAGNLTNLMLQITAVGHRSRSGVVLVLLLGEIDLSVGVVERPRGGHHGGAEHQARLGRVGRHPGGDPGGHRDRALPGLLRSPSSRCRRSS